MYKCVKSRKIDNAYTHTHTYTNIVTNIKNFLFSVTMITVTAKFNFAML